MQSNFLLKKKIAIYKKNFELILGYITFQTFQTICNDVGKSKISKEKIVNSEIWDFVEYLYLWKIVREYANTLILVKS